MLRAIVLGFGIVLLLCAAVLALTIPAAWPVALELGILGLLVVGATLFERRYRVRVAPGGTWQSTGERFVDPTSGKMVEVRYNPQTGQRQYIEASDSNDS